MSKGSYLKGLNTLRFFAAFFVIISHGEISLSKLGFGAWSQWTIFNRGVDAVEFFFTLSGFLITWLLQKEIAATSTVSIRDFYLRRIFRIWPLYFLIVIIGFVGLGLIFPRLTGQHILEFPLFPAALLFLFFLPNLAAALYPVALMHPLWSIGVEEQYYLFWAPLVKAFRHRIMRLVIIFLGISIIWYVLVYYRVLSFSDTLREFFLYQKFYAMATGGLFGCICYRYADAYKRSFWAHPVTQWIVFLAVVAYYVVGLPILPFQPGCFLQFTMSGLYGLLILNSALPEKPAVNLEKQPFVYLGIISYGLYMYHMVVDYILRYTCIKFRLADKLGFAKLIPIYFVALLGGAIVVASLSYTYLESFFLRLKERYA